MQFFLNYTNGTIKSNLSFEHFPHLKKGTHAVKQATSFFCPFGPWKPFIYFQHLQICLFWIFYIHGVLQNIFQFKGTAPPYIPGVQCSTSMATQADVTETVKALDTSLVRG